METLRCNAPLCWTRNTCRERQPQRVQSRCYSVAMCEQKVYSAWPKHGKTRGLAHFCARCTAFRAHKGAATSTSHLSPKHKYIIGDVVKFRCGV
mmetsp:Transcript_35137/g.113818  ORF Transcript_35137/g.113818 Transcript_35137/m.113818 type:complete len:94 (+) Transcript_35137:102-383(+)